MGRDLIKPRETLVLGEAGSVEHPDGARQMRVWPGRAFLCDHLCSPKSSEKRRVSPEAHHLKKGAIHENSESLREGSNRQSHPAPHWWAQGAVRAVLRARPQTHGAARDRGHAHVSLVRLGPARSGGARHECRADGSVRRPIGACTQVPTSGADEMNDAPAGASAEDDGTPRRRFVGLVWKFGAGGDRAGDPVRLTSLTSSVRASWERGR